MRRFVILRLARSPTSDTAWVDRVLDSVGGEAVGVVICVFSSYQEHRGDTDCFAATIIYSTGVLFTTAGWYYRRTTWLRLGRMPTTALGERSLCDTQLPPVPPLISPDLAENFQG